MELYQLDKLMEETRQLAAKYRDATGQPLPVSHDLACYDAIRYLNLKTPDVPESGVDAIGMDELAGQKFQIKGRVHFSAVKGKQQRIGQVNIEGSWDICLLVILNEDYQTLEILAADKTAIREAIGNKKTNKRGAMTVSQFRAIAEIIWEPEEQDANVNLQDV
ncbi:MAG: hypothetical protein DRQ47_03530 [Gammaproteobacteria bacterium]|nr:MAG: hypothetical protein DRQ47_03530 [Gammaproteobacteria bacterium]